MSLLRTICHKTPLLVEDTSYQNQSTFLWLINQKDIRNKNNLINELFKHLKNDKQSDYIFAPLRTKDFETLEKLLQLCICPDQYNNQVPSLMYAIDSCPEGALLLIKYGANVELTLKNKQSKYYGWNPLLLAAHKNQKNVFDALIEKGAQINVET